MSEVNAPGWYPDPEGSDGERWWDGKKWGASVLPRLNAPTTNLANEKIPEFSPPVKAQEENVDAEAENAEVEPTVEPQDEVEEPVETPVDDEVSEDVAVAEASNVNDEAVEEVPVESIDAENNVENKDEPLIIEAEAEMPAKAKKVKKEKPAKAEKSSSKKRKMLSIFGVIAVLALLGAAAVYFLVSSESPAPVVETPGQEEPVIEEPTEEPTVTLPEETLDDPENAYPSYVESNFMDSCKPGADGQAPVCECIFVTIQNTLTFTDFQKLDEISNKSPDSWTKKETKAVEQLKAITNDCVLKHYDVQS